jgi:hypothetical protein
MSKIPIIERSNRSEAYASFGKGPLTEIRIDVSIDRNTGLCRRYVLFSRGGRRVIINYLFGKLLWDELSVVERKLFLSLHECTRDRTIYLSLKALVFGVPKSILRERLETLSKLGLCSYVSRQQYLSIKGQTLAVLFEETFTLRKVPKYSGYTRHYKDQGSLGKPHEEFLNSELDDLFDMKEFDDIVFLFLTVGELTLLSDNVYVLPE